MLVLPVVLAPDFDPASLAKDGQQRLVWHTKPLGNDLLAEALVMQTESPALVNLDGLATTASISPLHLRLSMLLRRTMGLVRCQWL
jgi:hypothetical protein